MRTIPLVSLLLLAGLATEAQAAKRTKLKKLDVAALQVSILDGSQRFCAGEPHLLKVTAQLADGSTLDTAGDTGLRMRDFDLSSTAGGVDRKGVLLVENTGLELLDRVVQVRVSAKKQDASASVDLTPHFGCSVSLDYRGGTSGGAAIRDGGNGIASVVTGMLLGSDSSLDGERGADGIDGKPGQDGGPGGQGGSGSPGHAGHDLTVDVGTVQAADGTPLTLVAITSAASGEVRTVLLDTAQGATLHLDVSGGAGGSGGDGGTGGSGGAGDPAVNGGVGGNGSIGGNGGAGGPGGRGGNVVVRYDARVPALASVVSVTSQGGPGGSGGRGGSFGSGGSGYGDAASGSMGSTDSASGPYGAEGAPGQVMTQATPAEALFQGVASM